MKYYLDCSKSVLALMLVSPLLVGLGLAGALLSGKPIIFGLTRQASPRRSFVVIPKEVEGFEQVA